MPSVLGGRKYMFLCSHQKRTFSSSKVESTELFQREDLEQGLRLFFGFFNTSHFFSPNKAGQKNKTAFCCISSHRGLNYTSLSGWPESYILSLRKISLNISSEMK